MAGSDIAARPASRRGLAIAVLACVVLAAVALLAASRTWAVDTVVRPAPLPVQRVGRTGSALAPFVPASALVVLAGAGALLATRRLGRVLVAALLVVAGLAVAAGGAYGLAAIAGVRPAWPIVTLLAGLGIAAVGGYALVRGRGWPAMGARYERPAATARPPAAEASPAQLWDALDRGDDPTLH